MFIRSLGVDEHRFRTVLYAQGRSGKVIRVEPWFIVFTDRERGKILDILDGRCAGVDKKWLQIRPRY